MRFALSYLVLKESPMRVLCVVGVALAVVAGLDLTTWVDDPKQAEKPVEKAGPVPGPAELREMFLQLDTNNDTVIERDEVPESGREAFETLLKLGDTDKNDQLEAAELRTLIQKAGGGIRNPQALLRRFDNLDKDGDGKLTREEFRSSSAPVKGPTPAFDRFDQDKDGFLTKEEITRVASQGGPRPAASVEKAKRKNAAKKAGDTPAPLADSSPPARAKASARAVAKSGQGVFARRFETLDKDGDGQVTRDEFQGPALLFDRLDSNADGSLSTKEYAKLQTIGLGLRFLGMDNDGDGRVSRDEYLGPAPTFGKIDENGDGGLTLEEFLRFHKPPTSRATPEKGEEPATPPSDRPGRDG
jgi:Ca2+-binding EF-hand superfamily protein